MIRSKWVRAGIGLVALSALGGARADQDPGKTGSLSAQARFRVSTSGDEVTDVQAKLTWRRCVEGMQWDGTTCTGQAIALDHAQAQARAKAAFQATRLPWRLPHVPELKRLIDTHHHDPAVDVALFPNTPPRWHWSASSSIAGGAAFNPYNYGNIAQGKTSSNVNQLAFLHGWAVNFSTGESQGDIAKRTPMVVRLVRGAN